VREKKDQLQAHLFIVGRMVKALVQAEPDLVRTPLRRTTSGWVWGAVLGAVIAGIFAIIGFVSPVKSTKWQVAGAIVEEKESGAQFIYLDGRLRPVANLTSARLAAGAIGGGLGTTNAPPVSVSRKSLTTANKGPMIGIVGAPESLPQPQDLYAGAWSLCAVKPAAGADSTLVVDLPAAPADPVPVDKAMLVQAGPAFHLLWNGRRYPVVGAAAMTAMGAGAVQPFQVPSAFVDSLPPGKALQGGAVTGVGKPGPVIGSIRLKVGQIARVGPASAPSAEYYLALGDGLLKVPLTEARLVLTAPANARAYPGRRPAPIEISAAGAAAARRSTETSHADGWPQTPPAVLGVDPAGGTQPCATLALPAQGPATAVFGLGRAATGASAPVVGRGGVSVRVRSGSGALIARGGAPGTSTKAPDPNKPAPPVWLLTDDGRGYPLTDDQSRSSLGYSDLLAVPVPPALLAVLPTGPALTQQGALTTLDQPAATPTAEARP
jgi:type VII secretion protein EccB